MAADSFLELLGQYVRQHLLVAAGVAVGIFFLVRLLTRALRTVISRDVIGDDADLYPELELLLFRVIAKARIADCEALVNYVLVDRPSKMTRAMLRAYRLRVGRLSLEMDEPIADDALVTGLALRILQCASVQARGSRPSVQHLDPAATLPPMFDVPELAKALRASGLTKLKVQYFLAHGRALPEIENFDTLTAEHVWIRVHNDRFSTEAFVNRLLSEVFACDHTAALEIVNDVQHFGEAALGPYTASDAAARINRAVSMAREAEEPLMLSLSEHPPSTRRERPLRGEANPYAPPKSTHL